MIGAILDQITGGLMPYLAAAGAALVALVGSYFKGRSDARRKAVVKELKQRVENLQTAKEVDDEVDAKTDAAVRADLGKWVRPE